LVEELFDDQWSNLIGLTNNFIYKENIHALYAIVGNKVNKFSYQLGIRAEASIISTELKQSQEVNEQSYYKLFPSSHLNYELENDNGIQLSYSRRLSRPRFHYLNPFFSFSDSRNFHSGNPNLEPEFTNSYELGHIKYWENGSLTSSVYYRKTNNDIEWIREVNQDGNTISRPENLVESENWGFEFTFSSQPIDWLKVDGDVNLYNSKVNGANIGRDFKAEAYTASGRLSTKVSFWENANGQARFYYSAPRNSTQGRRLSYYSLDLAFSKDIFRNTTFTASARDILDTRKRRSITDLLNYYSVSEHQWRSRQLTFTLNYRLNQEKKRGGDRNRGGGGFDQGGEEF
jgi:outer membrane receptor protein involved in Fe transport